jgi:hypothetical protein
MKMNTPLFAAIGIAIALTLAADVVTESVVLATSICRGARKPP